MPTTSRREERRPAIDVDDFLADRGPSWRWPFATLALDSGPLGRSSLGPGRCVGAGWRGMPARAICCEPDSGKCGRQAVDEPIAKCIFRQVEGVSMGLSRLRKTLLVLNAPS